MEYTLWRDDVFGQPGDADPVRLDLRPETYSASPEEHLDHIDRALDDLEIHRLYTSKQIGNGLRIIYDNSCGNICYCYLETANEQRRVAGIRRLDRLYANYFDRYCQAPVGHVGNDHLEGAVGYLCYMFWDIFVLWPTNATAAMVTAGLDVMRTALQMSNDNCIASAIHGLGHWASYDPRSVKILRKWLERPTSRNPRVIEYAVQARTGCIL